MFTLWAIFVVVAWLLGVFLKVVRNVFALYAVGSFACDSASGHMLFRVLWCDASNSRKHRSVSDSFYKNLFIFSLDNWDCGRLESTNRWNGCLFATLGPSVFLAWYCSVTPLHVTCKISALFSEKII